MRAVLAGSVIAAFALGCGGNGASSSSTGTGGAGTGTASGPSGSTGATGSASTGSGGAASCDAFGLYGTSKSSFTLPATDGQSISYPDVQAAFPMVDWMTIDRLYVPAGHYKSVEIGNLPNRTAASPLVITNKGGQVAIGPNDPNGNFIWAINGGSHWILTGRYDADSATGDVGFAGHRCGDYAGSRGHYGFISDDAYAKGTYLHMGLAVQGATDFEIEYLEVTRSGFAGIRLLNPRAAGDPPFDMANVKVHDNYVHDTDGEGFYFGWTGAPPSNLLPGLQVYQNRLVRTGNEGLQIQNLGDGTEVHHNVVAFAALHWRDNGLGHYQDNNSQMQIREGTISIHDNVFTGGASSLLNYFNAPEPGDGESHVTFDHDYFGETKELGPYLNGASGPGSDIHFTNTVFSGLDFTYDVLDPTATDPGIVLGVNGNIKGPLELSGIQWGGPRKLVNGLTGPNGTVGAITATGNTNADVPPVTFVASGYPAGVPTQKLEAWAPKATVAPGSPDIVYQPGDVVMFDAVMYQCTATSTGQKPADHPEAWQALPTPTDDLRIPAGSPYAGYGVH